MLIGDDADVTFAGAAWVYGRTASGWSEEQKIVPTDAPSPEFVDFGLSVSLSSDGSTVLIGGPGGTGQAWIYANPSQTTNATTASTTTTTTTSTTTATTSSPLTSTTPSRPLTTHTVTATVDGHKVTLVLPRGVLAKSLKGHFKANKIGSKALKFVSAAVYVDKGVKHVERAKAHSSGRAKRTYTANATLKRMSESFALNLKTLSKGAHTLNVIVTYKKKAGRRTETVSRTLKARFTVA